MSAILGWGIGVPEHRLTNAEIEGRGVETTDAWIVERTGIRERRIASPEDTTSSLAATAGAAAIKSAGLTPDDIDLLILATTTPDQKLPATAPIVQDMLGLRCGAIDLNAACSGWVYSLVFASSLMQTGGVGGGIRHALVIGSEVLSSFVDPIDRGTVILFGDGAGAAVVGPGDGIIAWDLGSDGSLASILEVPAGGSKQAITPEVEAARDQYIKMEGREVFRRAVRVVVDSVGATLERAGLTAADVDCFIPHQANARIVEAIISRLGIPAEKTVVNLDVYGNTSAASIPIALYDAAEAGRMKSGDLVLLSGFGAGMTWATALVRWP